MRVSVTDGDGSSFGMKGFRKGVYDPLEVASAESGTCIY